MDNTHVALLSSPGKRHIVSALALGYHLATLHKVKVTILVITIGTSSAGSPFNVMAIPESNLACLDIVELPPVDISRKMTPTAKPISALHMIVHEALPSIRSAIQSMEKQPSILVVDRLCSSALPIADEFDMSKYLYVSTSARATSLFMYCHVLDKEIKGSYLEQEEPLKIPGCKPIVPEDIVDAMLDRSEREYQEYMKLGLYFRRCDGILINTCEALEPTSLKALRENEIFRSILSMPVHSIGPLIQPLKTTSLKSEVLEWLNKQSAESVIYVALKIERMLSAEQIIELAWGLELSQQRFIWVVPGVANQGSDSNSTMDHLPEGFSDRTKDLGIVIPTWVQELEILGHPSTGGFLSDCEWKSTLESIVSGVPMIAWPLLGEQKLNATMLVEDLGMAIRPEVLPTKKVVGREEIGNMVRKVMEYEEGRAMREKVKQLKLSVEDDLSKSGSSFKSMSDAVEDMSFKSRYGSPWAPF